MPIPKPLVQFNQSFILVTVLSGIFIQPLLLVLPFITGLITLINKKNPIILLGKPFLRKPAASYPLEDKAQQLFNQWIATICIGLALISFSIGIDWLAYLFCVMVALASGLALAGYCIGCTIRYRYMMWKHKQKTSHQG
ncbi:DUF4395 domain-containing protein [Gracilibacillus caseinilyticus]|uniref:DUF4395 domain-containing protein n=1 Tax=Gracilibacillus caseinilyticus TaxID=2932256 RepID=A0ABY4F092_9BACI|nr:DUF4395 domain-containing protein [Gracilibacillus caseinilyticus]UOQ49935.1 DUF4395 domain-containing protein [Gracilibacillus caseinilyticus]